MTRRRMAGRRATWSIAARLTAWYAGAAFVLVTGAVWMQYRALARDLAGEDDQLLLETTAAVRHDLDLHATRGSVADPDSLRRLLAGWRPGSGAGDGPAVRLLDSACRAIDVRGRRPLPPPDCRVAGAEPRLRSWLDPDGAEWRIATSAIPTAGVTLEILLDRGTDVAVLARFRHQLYALLAAALGVAIAVGFLIARRGLAPIGRLARRVTVIDASSLGQRLSSPDAPQEVRELTASFDDMLARLESAFAALSGYSAEMAHELRTPLHVLRQQIEVALARARTPDEYRDLLGSSLEEIDRLRRMTDDILFLARAEDPRSRVHRERLDAGDELRSVAEFMEAIAEERRIRLVVDAPPRVALDADRTLVRRALVNLVTNAIRHTPAGGTVRLVATTDDDRVVLAVEDTGSGVPADALPRVFDRFYRAPASAGDGAGLGLAIVESIARLHGGVATAASASGQGARFALELPRDDPPSTA